MGSCLNRPKNTATIDAGVVKRILMFSSKPTANHNNPGMVRAEVKVNGRVIAPLQPIDNFRSKEVAFIEDGQPIENIGGCQVEVNVIAPNAFTAATELDFVFIYENCN